MYYCKLAASDGKSDAFVRGAKRNIGFDLSTLLDRPIDMYSSKAKRQSVPENFTVLTAAGGDQTAKPLEETKHGLFSYFVMKSICRHDCRQIMSLLFV